MTQHDEIYQGRLRSSLIRLKQSDLLGLHQNYCIPASFVILAYRLTEKKTLQCADVIISSKNVYSTFFPV